MSTKGRKPRSRTTLLNRIAMTPEHLRGLSWFHQLPPEHQRELLKLRAAYRNGRVDRTQQFLYEQVRVWLAEKNAYRLPGYTTFREWLLERRAHAKTNTR